jgi:hypothetical protein
MSTQLTAQAYDNFLGLLDDALALAKEAFEVAAKPTPAPAKAPEPEVHLTKVASHVYEKTAAALMRTGVFDDTMTQVELRQTLEEAGEAGHLAILEKLASRAAFPLNVRMDLRGELVERQTSTVNTEGMSKQTATWRQALDDARSENS